MANETKRKRSPIVRIGIDLDQIIVTEDGIETPEGFAEWVPAQREKERELLLFGVFGDEIVADLEGLGFFKSSDDGGLGFSKDDLHLAGDDAAKHKAIRGKRLSHYIAGDLEIFESRHFTRRAQPILFSYMISDDHPTFADWPSVDNYLGWSVGVRKLSKNQLRKISPIKEYGDNFIYHLNTMADEPFILKRYYEKDTGDHDRLKVEVKNLKNLSDAGLATVPTPMWNDGAEWVVFNYVEGKDVTDAGDKDVELLSQFLIDLDNTGEKLKKRRIAPAFDARLTLKDYVKGIKTLWDLVFNSVQRGGLTDVTMFMMTDLEQMRQDNINHFYLWCKREKWDQEAELPKKERIFNPGDFGFHNAIRRPDGNLVFVDFEYSGWDDPAKLMADFFYNTNQNLDMDKKLKVLDAFVQHRDWDKNFLNRFWAVCDLVAVEWIVRRLLVCVPAEQHRLMLADPNVNIPKLIEERLAEAQELRNNYKPMEHLCKHAQLLEDESELK